MDTGKLTFAAGGKRATLHLAKGDESPLVVLNAYQGDGASIVEALEGLDAPDHSLLVVYDLDWDHDMAPWHCPPLTATDTPYTGGAEGYLEVLLGEIIPHAETLLGSKPSFMGIAGYSLAGLFALWSAYNCDAFARIASMSGSLWFPGLLEFVQTHEMARMPNGIYLSLGKAEARTPNRYLRTVREHTETLAQRFEAQGIDVTFELNPGNHFKDVALRSAKGIASILKRQ